MIRCFRTAIDGITDFVEFEDNNIARQISVFPEIVVLLQGEEAPEATLDRCDLRPEDEIAPDEFQKAWEHYQTQPHGTRSNDIPIIKEIRRQRGLE